jgi:CRP/FNR family cyclic AMP-dependent transcriptional regulator
MESTRSRMDLCPKGDGDPPETAALTVPRRHQGGKSQAQDRSRLGDAEARADALALAAPFSDWPREALLRLAAASSAASHPPGTMLIVNGQRCDQITVVAEGTVLTSVSTPSGRRLTYKIDDAAFAYGLASLADGLPLQIDLLADGPVSVIRTPIAAVRAELARMPALWESIAVETIRRSRRYATQLNQFVLDTPLVRAASLLLDLLVRRGQDGVAGAVLVDFRLSQERLADMLGISRQWATAVVRELVQAGLVEWRYGRVTVLDVQALRSLATKGADGRARCGPGQAPPQ